MYCAFTSRVFGGGFVEAPQSAARGVEATQGAGAGGTGESAGTRGEGGTEAGRQPGGDERRRAHAHHAGARETDGQAGEQVRARAHASITNVHMAAD